MNKNVKDLIVIEQLPKIKATLEELSKQVKEDVDKAVSLVCNEDTVKDVKNKRAELNKQFKELEEQRKFIKTAIMEKYNDFEEVYKEKISNIYKNADETLKTKIDSIENEIKQQKEAEIREFALEHIQDAHLEEILDYEAFNLNITLSVSMKKLKEEILDFINNVEKDVKLIELEEFKDEILLEYKNTLDFAKAKLTVIERHKALEELKKQEAVRVEAIEEERQVVEMVVEELHAPVEVEEVKTDSVEETIEVTFTVRATKEKLKTLQQFMKEEGIDYD